MDHQRKEERKKLMAFTPVYNSKQKALIGYVGDITLKGILVIGEKSVNIGEQITLTIEVAEADLPGLVDGKFTIPAKTAWCRRDAESADFYNIGFEFTEVSPQNTVIIDSIIARYHFRHHMSDPEFKAK